MAYRMIQVGLGDFGRRWLAVVRAHPAWQYTALATRNSAVLRQCAQEVALPATSLFPTLRDAIDADCRGDALLVTTPHFRHLEDVTAGLARGLHVLVEKPLAGSWEDALAIWNAARASSGSLMVAENYRFGEGARLARDVVASGEIGRPEFLGLDYFVGHTFPDGDWRNDYRYPLLIENATHHFDLVRFVTGTEAECVSCTAFGSQRTPQWEYPSVSAHFAMSDGFQFRFSGSWAYSELATPWEGVWRLHGSKGTLCWHRDRLEVHRGSTVREIPAVSHDSDHTLAATFAEFTTALDDNRPPQTSIDDNLKTLAMVYGAIQSSEQQRIVSLCDILPPSTVGSTAAKGA